MLRTSTPRARRTQIATRIAAQLLENGVASIPLRVLAAKLETSDRMLLYYFDNKEDLVRSSLDELALGLGRNLITATLPRTRPRDLLRAIWSLFSSPPISPYLTVWADVSARGARGEEPFRSITAESIAGSLAWLEAQLDMADTPQRQVTAASILSILEGARMMEAASPGAARGAVAFLAEHLETTPLPPVSN